MKTPRSRGRAKRNGTARGNKNRFSVHRTVNWGDCDPAGFIYTPRVLDYACEMVDAWFREKLNASWWQLKSRSKGLGLPTVNAVCDFLSVVRPDQTLQLNMNIREVGTSSVVFEIEGVAAGNRRVFRVKLVSCAVEMVKCRATPIPRWMRNKFEAYKNACN
jgi:4-hydroxybenzoyl-CoA thioesterase